MKDMLQETENLKALAIELGMLLTDHKGINVIVMDMRQLNFWTDFFVIATVTSSTHLSGLERHIKEYVREKGLDIQRRSRKLQSKVSSDLDNEWSIMDLGNIVIHLMSGKSRSFFELERLWNTAALIYEDPSYSSKSS